MSTNKSEQAERKALAGSNNITTLHQQAMIGLKLDSPGGRFAQQSTLVTGSEPTVNYPRLPSGPWADTVRLPDEPPLGFSVNDLEPTGTPVEVAASLGPLAETPVASPTLKRRRL